MYDYCEPRTICPPSLVVSVSDCGMGGLGSIPGWAHKLHCFFSSVLVFYAELLHTSNMEFKNVKHIYFFTFYIELCTKYVGVGVNWALLKEN